MSRQLIRQLRPIVAMIRRHDADLARQLQRAASSVHLNLSESQGREGGDRRRFFEFAAGSAFEVRGALQAADDWGWIGDVGPVHRTAHRMIALLWGLRRTAP